MRFNFALVDGVRGVSDSKDGRCFWFGESGEVLVSILRRPDFVSGGDDVVVVVGEEEASMSFSESGLVVVMLVMVLVGSGVELVGLSGVVVTSFMVGSFGLGLCST